MVLFSCFVLPALLPLLANISLGFLSSQIFITSLLAISSLVVVVGLIKHSGNTNNEFKTSGVQCDRKTYDDPDFFKVLPRNPSLEHEVVIDGKCSIERESSTTFGS